MQLRRKPSRLNDRAYQAAKDELLKKLEAVAQFADTDAKKEDRIAKGLDDAFYFARTYLPHYFSTTAHDRSSAQAEYHPDLVEACEIEETPVTITGPRGGAKSTIVSFLEVIRDACYQREDFIVINMKSYDRAELYTLRILTELQHNPRIIEDFGRLVSKAAGAGNFATRRTPTRERSTRIMAWGDGMSMRGLVSEYSRPTKIICEDLQDREAAENPKRTSKLLEKIKTDWLQATAAKHWKFIVLGNVICTGSIIDRLQKEEKAWKHYKFLAERRDAVGNRVATWPEQFPLERLDKIILQIGHVSYAAEYLCEPTEVNPAVDPEKIRHWEKLPKFKGRVYLVLDPSVSEFGDNKALFAMVLWKRRVKDEDYMTLRDARGKLYEAGLYNLVLRCWNRQATTDEMFEELYKYDGFYNRPTVLYDGTFGQKRIMRKLAAPWAIKMGRRLRLLHYILNRPKPLRIAELAQDIQAGFVLFPLAAGEQERDVKETIMQLVRYGKPNVKDDGPDALAAGVEKANKISNPASVG